MSSHNHEKTIVPAVPEFRRMQIGAAPAMPKPVAMGIRKTPQIVTSKPSPPPPEWKITSTSIPLLDEFYPLEKTHAIISEDAQTVADRIAKQFHSQSIAISSDEHSCTVVLEDRTELVIQLFWDEKKSLVIECQRIQGCGFTFRQLAKAVLQAAKGVATSTPAVAATQRPPVPAIPGSSPSHGEEALNLALGLIQSDRMDARELGCQSLLQLTTTTAGVAISNQQVHDIVKQLPALNQKNNDSYLRPFSLQILGNLLERTSAFSGLPEEVVLSLQQDAKASSDPLTAHQAARCLEALRPSGPPAMPPPRPVC